MPASRLSRRPLLGSLDAARLHWIFFFASHQVIVTFVLPKRAVPESEGFLGRQRLRDRKACPISRQLGSHNSRHDLVIPIAQSVRHIADFKLAATWFLHHVDIPSAIAIKNRNPHRQRLHSRSGARGYHPSLKIVVKERVFFQNAIINDCQEVAPPSN